MRRLLTVAMTLVFMAGCGTFGGGGESGPQPAKTVEHVILYQLYAQGGSNFMITLNYTDSTGRQKHEESTAPSWAKQVTVRYPDVMLVAISGNAVATPMAPAPLGTGLPRVQCILTVDGEIVDQKASILPTCEATLTATARPIPKLSAN
ncbi:hypothetical protein [Frankia sp. Cj3]|uniref:hypothetical protein n=2 Tax=unclassified Frankia TaxID=2632575 RepID=UPI001EF3F2E6|nr:hypothetical protein [Frankia sp. Cj3]